MKGDQEKTTAIKGKDEHCGPPKPETLWVLRSTSHCSLGQSPCEGHGKELLHVPHTRKKRENRTQLAKVLGKTDGSGSLIQ